VQQLSRLQLLTQTNSEKVFHITLQAAKKMAQIGAKGFDFSRSPLPTGTRSRCVARTDRRPDLERKGYQMAERLRTNDGMLAVRA